MSSQRDGHESGADAEECPLQEKRCIDSPQLRLAQLSAPTRFSSIEPLRSRLVSAPTDFEVRDQDGTPKIWMALEEAIANAFYHGNLELDSSLKEGPPGQFSDLASERCGRSPWKDRRIEVTELATPVGVWITLRDQGSGFNVAAAMKKTEDPFSLLLSGRGLVMMKSFTDELFFNEQGNEVTLVFYRQGNSDINDLLEQHSDSQRIAG